MGKNICGGCTLIFGSLTAFDKHRVGGYKGFIYELAETGLPTGKILGERPSTRRCLTVEEIQALGMVQNDRGWWIEELTEAKREQLERLKQKKVAEIER
jgi:hypothetical protein